MRKATQAGDKRALARALDYQNTLLVRTGRQDEAIHMGRALELYEELGDGVQARRSSGRQPRQHGVFRLALERGSRLLGQVGGGINRAVGDLATTALAHVNGGDLRVNQGRLEEALALLGPARRTLESYGYRAATAWTEMCLGRATAFHGDLEGGIALERSALASFDEIGSHMESLEACARLAEVLVFGRRLSEAEEALAQAHELERHVGHNPLVPLVERVDLTLAAFSGDSITLFSNRDGFLDRAENLGATYEALVVLALAERFGATDRHAEIPPG